MADRPIIFSGPMVRALLDGRKTQTRRVLKPPYGTMEYLADGSWRPIVTQFVRGDRLWLRETWSEGRDGPGGAIFPIYAAEWGNRGTKGYDLMKPWRSSIFMPRKYSRLTLIVKEVRVQRLQEISEEDARAEGLEQLDFGWKCYLPEPKPQDAWQSPVESYRTLWNSLNAKRGYSWDSNPWCVALTFDVIRQNIDARPTGSAAGM